MKTTTHFPEDHNDDQHSNVPPPFPFKTCEAFLAYIRKNPDKVIQDIGNDPRYKQFVLKAKRGEVHVHQDDSFARLIWCMLRYLLIVPPNSLHGRVKVNDQLKTWAACVAALLSVSNIWDTATAVPVSYFSVGGGVPGFFLALLTIVVCQTFSNKTAEIAAVGCHKHQHLAGVATFGWVAMSVLLTLISGYGSDIATNGVYLAKFHAREIIDNEVLAKSNRDLEIASMKTKEAKALQLECDQNTAKWASLSKSDPARDALYRLNHGPWGVKPSYWNNQPTDPLPTCPKAARLAQEGMEEQKKAQTALSQKKAEVELVGNPLTFLKEQKPDLYDLSFTDDGYIRSGTQVVETAITSFNQRLFSGNIGALGFSLIGLGISVITTVSAVSITMVHRRLPSVVDTFDRSFHDAQEEFFHAVSQGLNDKEDLN
jgi:hypothetical protein